MELAGETAAAQQLFAELLTKSRFGFFRLLAEAGLYRMSQ